MTNMMKIIENSNKIYIIGDIHGCFYTLLDVIESISKSIEDGDTVVFLGDYFDRGPHSANVYQLLRQAERDSKMVFNKKVKVICLKGNHEQLLVDAIAGNKFYKNTYLWSANGGQITKESFYDNGINIGEVKDWAKNLPMLAFCPKYQFYCVHSYIPNNYLRGDFSYLEDYEDCLWYRKPNIHLAPQRVFHGHTKLENVTVVNNDIDIDTGCVVGNKLTYAVVEDFKNFKYKSINRNNKDKVNSM